MTIDIKHGSPQFPSVSSSITSSTRDEMDAALRELRAHKDAWVALTASKRVVIVDRLIRDFASIAPRWVDACVKAKGIPAGAPAVAEEWGAGAWPVMKNLRQLRKALGEIAELGYPRIPGPVSTRPDGQVVAQVFPLTSYDRIFFMGVTAELWMEPGVTAETLKQTQAEIYHDSNHSSKVALVLGAGNVSSIGPLDILYKLFEEDQVVILKMNPVNAYLGPLINECFRALVEPGFLRVVYGGASEGAYLCNSELVDDIHVTGSDKTFDAIVFGTGAEGAARKASQQPLLTKRITGELGNVSPVIVVPGPWSDGDLAYQAEHLVTMLTNNAGFNCNATRVIITHSGWQQRDKLLQHVREVLQKVPPRNAYYPGAQERQRAFVAEHAEAEQFGTATSEQLPWTLIPGVDPQNEGDICFTTEAFCGLFAETPLDAGSVSEYIDRAVAFCNDELWGTLNATILVHPASLKDPQVKDALDRAVAKLRYGTIGVNYWAGTGFAIGVTTWGAYPDHPLHDIQSGTGLVHNTLMFAHSQKSVLRAPFRSTPKPSWFVTQGKVGRKVFPKIVAFDAAPSPWKVPGILWTAITG
ncbi:MAG TPA: aldehyde dehydrogenase family protein [Ktedonobacteraceae bacterium]|nr:aldehyde dehydrogenase family protein [Ktedonobacteraceae bacterium]